MRIRQLLTLLVLLLNGGRAQAQGENNNWTFNFLYGINFSPTGPVFQPSSYRAGGSCSAISDASGNLLFYTNGRWVWDRNQQVMPSACSGCNGAPAELTALLVPWHGALIVKRPGSGSLYYVFTTDSPQDVSNPGPHYTEVDMSLRGGLGGVTLVRGVRLTVPSASGNTTGGVIGMQHANRRDVWVLVHGLDNDLMHAFLVTAGGISPVPVTSITSRASIATACIMKFSPDGRHLAMVGDRMLTDLYDFNAATGQLSNRQSFDASGSADRIYDLEFSADATKLYQTQAPFSGSGRDGGFLYQYDLQAGTTAAISSSKQLIYQSRPADDPYTPPTGLEIGPDGRIYSTSGVFIGIIDRPNRRGTDVHYRPIGMLNRYVGGIQGISDHALQNIVRLQPPSLDYTAEPVCAGGTLTLTPYEVPTGTGPLTWTFADPLTGQADSVQGVSVTRTFPVPGAYPVTLSTTSRGQYYRLRRTVLVAPLPTAALPDTVRLCLGETPLVGVPTPDGTTVRWSDGSTAASRPLASPGRYEVQVRNYLGCEVTASTVAVACRIPNLITPNGDGANDTFRPQGLEARRWDLDIYDRWGRLVYRQAGYDNNWNAPQQPAGVYYYRLVNPRSGQQLKGWLEVAR